MKFLDWFNKKNDKELDLKPDDSFQLKDNDENMNGALITYNKGTRNTFLKHY
jgi:hypothetical protein